MCMRVWVFDCVHVWVSVQGVCYIKLFGARLDDFIFQYTRNVNKQKFFRQSAVILFSENKSHLCVCMIDSVFTTVFVCLYMCVWKMFVLVCLCIFVFVCISVSTTVCVCSYMCVHFCLSYVCVCESVCVCVVRFG